MFFFVVYSGVCVALFVLGDRTPSLLYSWREADGPKGPYDTPVKRGYIDFSYILSTDLIVQYTRFYLSALNLTVESKSDDGKN